MEISEGSLESEFLSVCEDWLKKNDGYSVRGELGVFSTATVLWLGVCQRFNCNSLESSLLSLVQRLNSGLDFPFTKRASKKLRSGKVSFNTGGISRARDRISSKEVEEVFNSSADNILKKSNTGRRVYVMDGQMVAISRTIDNLLGFSPTGHKEGELHYPRIRIVSVHDLDSGVASRVSIGDCKQSEVKLARKAIEAVEQGSLIIMDRGYDKPVFLDFTQEVGVNVLVRLKNSKGKKLLGKCNEPNAEKSVEWDAKTADGKPVTMHGRVIKFTAQIKGFRSSEFYFFTDDDSLSIEQVAEYYKKRVSVEVFIRDIKQTLKMFFVRAKKAENVHKEILLAYLTFNLLRSIMKETASSLNLPAHRMSFTSTIRLCKAYASLILHSPSKVRTKELMENFKENMNQAKLPKRKKVRSYPREIKLPRDRYPTAGIVRKSKGVTIVNREKGK